ncbi:MAG: phosphopyruvate hydratase [Patescibacteria group bacterium]|nr:phosphopyruvate hydratase [bacterium]MDZ4241087.1 phosphopyruvate hydratase [Patescibacteria group bacterium]
METIKKIRNIFAREVLDSRGNPTVEVDVTLEDGAFGRAAIPSGASTGTHEAVELRDGDKKRYQGKGVSNAVTHVNTTLSNSLVGKEFGQENLDKTMLEIDGTENKSNLGANAILGVSLGFSHAAAQSEKKPLYRYFNDISGKGKMILPVPLMNILNGGKHALNSTDLQEFMIVPHGAQTFKEALRYGSEIFHTLKKVLEEMNCNVMVGDEGGYAPALPSNEAAIEVILKSIDRAGYVAGKDVSLAIDAASNELYADGKYNLKTEGKNLTTDEMIAMYVDWQKKYPLISLEDGLYEDDWDGYKKLTDILGGKMQIVGDDLFVTNPVRLEKGITEGVGNSILVKLNQIGTVTETIHTIEIARKARYTSIISHRSGETEDTTIADFAVGLGTGQIKTGSLSRSERVAKYNRLLRIEEELGNEAVYAGKKTFPVAP